VNITVNVGDNATIQVVETAIHGAALYSVRLPPPILENEEERLIMVEI
jgi:hypothetical protein